MSLERNYYDMLENGAQLDNSLLANLHSTDNQNLYPIEDEMAQNQVQQFDQNNNGFYIDNIQ